MPGERDCLDEVKFIITSIKKLILMLEVLIILRLFSIQIKLKIKSFPLLSFGVLFKCSYICFCETSFPMFRKCFSVDVFINSFDFLLALPFFLLGLLFIHVNSLFEIVLNCVSHSVEDLLNLLKSGNVF